MSEKIIINLERECRLISHNMTSLRDIFYQSLKSFKYIPYIINTCPVHLQCTLSSLLFTLKLKANMIVYVVWFYSADAYIICSLYPRFTSLDDLKLQVSICFESVNSIKGNELPCRMDKGFEIAVSQIF